MRIPDKRRKKYALMRRYGRRCWYCLEKFPKDLLTIEHLQNLRDGGSNRLENLRLACTRCNGARNDGEQRGRAHVRV